MREIIYHPTYTAAGTMKTDQTTIAKANAASPIIKSLNPAGNSVVCLIATSSSLYLIHYTSIILLVAAICVILPYVVTENIERSNFPQVSCVVDYRLKTLSSLRLLGESPGVPGRHDGASPCQVSLR
jgi:hypothetical protein